VDKFKALNINVETTVVYTQENVPYNTAY